MEGLPNPLDNIRKPTGSQARDRRLRPGEFEKLRTLLSASGNQWAAPAFELAIETSLRQSALFSVRWEWLDIGSRMIKFPPDARGAGNKGVPAALPLSRRAIDVFRHLAAIGCGRENGALPVWSSRRPAQGTKRTRVWHNHQCSSLHMETNDKDRQR
jgi:integrase